MSFRTIFFLIFLCYFSVLFQTSLLFHFSIWGHTINFILLLVILLNLFEPPEQKYGILTAFIGGFFLDIFSNGIIGFWILALLVLSFFIKLVLRKYVKIPTPKKII